MVDFIAGPTLFLAKSRYQNSSMKSDAENADKGRQIVKRDECGAIHVGRQKKDGSHFFCSIENRGRRQDYSVMV
jgi:hypothetical protein